MKIESHRYVPDSPNEGVWRGKTFVHILTKLIRSGQGTRLLDLGCGPCLFSFKAQACGYHVTALDARSEPVPPPEERPNIAFLQRDVRSFDPKGFEVIAVLGLLYHLELKAQLKLLGKCSRATVIVDTQFCEENFAPAEEQPWRRAFVDKQGFRGVLYPENENAMAAWRNVRSFWHTEDSLLRLFERCGFANVTRIVPQYSSKYGPRGFFLLKP